VADEEKELNFSNSIAEVSDINADNNKEPMDLVENPIENSAEMIKKDEVLEAQKNKQANNDVDEQDIALQMAEKRTAAEKKIVTLTKQLEFVFTKNSWISVKDGKNKSLIYDLIHKGEQLTLSGVSPIDIFLGDGTGVALTVDGEPFNFSTHINKKNIAKFIVK
ncbi:MAG: DUF4115 domain-containing protein, partial [Pseudomonadota bacterium]